MGTSTFGHNINSYTNEVSLMAQFHTHIDTCAFSYLTLQRIICLFIGIPIHLMKLWQKKQVLVNPSNIAIFERGFSKQNSIKCHLRASLELDILDALMRISL